MFVSDRLVFLELHKTGCTHIRDLLLEVVGGRLEGKHNRMPQALASSRRAVLGSVRDPWEWYLSLWAYGCDGKGELYQAAMARPRLAGLGWRSHPIRAALSLAHELGRRPARWKACYTHAEDEAAFRRWLALVLGGALPRPVLSYGAEPLGRVAGLLTYRYISLFCTDASGDARLDRIRDMSALMAYERDHCFVTRFIRNEALEDDLVGALRASGIALDQAAERRIRSGARTNVSSRRRSAASYYTPDTIAMVEARDRLVIERFGYRPPLLQAA